MTHNRKLNYNKFNISESLVRQKSIFNSLVNRIVMLGTDFWDNC